MFNWSAGQPVSQSAGQPVSWSAGPALMRYCNRPRLQASQSCNQPRGLPTQSGASNTHTVGCCRGVLVLSPGAAFNLELRPRPHPDTAPSVINSKLIFSCFYARCGSRRWEAEKFNFEFIMFRAVPPGEGATNSTLNLSPAERGRTATQGGGHHDSNLPYTDCVNMFRHRGP